MTEIGQSPNLIGSGIEKYASMSQATGKQLDGMEARMASVGKEFEGVFLSLMLKEMRNTLEGGGFFGEETSDTYGGMFDMFVGQDLAESSPLGIAEMLKNNLPAELPLAINGVNLPTAAAATYSNRSSQGTTSNQTPVSFTV